MAAPRVDDSDLKRGQRVLDEVADELERDAGLAHSYALATLEKARQNAASRPTPQAPMAADAMSVSGAEIRATAGGAPSAVAFGSEFGSDVYLQFQKPHTDRGYWLMPAAEGTEVLAAGDKALEDILERAVRIG